MEIASIFASPLALIAKMQRQIRLRQHAGALLRPFDRADGVLREVIANAHEFKLFRIGRAIQIEVIHCQRLQGIGFHQRVGRAFDVALMP